jgi:transcriptional regulator with XRE-family HTH domain
MSNYGTYIKALREAKNLTLREVEKQTEISNAYLSQLETGKVKQPSPLNLYKLAQLYDVSYETLMEKVGYPVPQKHWNGSKHRTNRRARTVGCRDG